MLNEFRFLSLFIARLKQVVKFNGNAAELIESLYIKIQLFVKIIFPIYFFIISNSYAAELFEGIKPGSVEYLDYKNGFRDVSFWDSPEKLKKTVACSEKKNLDDLKVVTGKFKVCYLEREIKPLLGYSINRIEYRYYNNNLFEIIVSLQGGHAASTLQRLKEKLEMSDKVVLVGEVKVNNSTDQIRHARRRCKNVIVKQLEEVWGDGSYNKYSIITWAGKVVYAQIDDECSKLEIRNLKLYHQVSEGYHDERIKYLESQF